MTILAACYQPSVSDDPVDVLPEEKPEVEVKPPRISAFEQKLIDAGLVSVYSVDSTIAVELKYATADNFLDTVLYDSISNCYLQPEVADMLAKAQEELKLLHPNYSLHVYDGVRPKSVQIKMWNVVKGTSKQRYVASPYNGSGMHNYGAAVDLTIADGAGNPLDMGTPFDYFGDLAQPRYNQHFLQQGDLTQEQVDNRLLLRKVMKAAGFRPIESEWWHFNAFSKTYTRSVFTVIE